MNKSFLYFLLLLYLFCTENDNPSYLKNFNYFNTYVYIYTYLHIYAKQKKSIEKKN